LESPYEMKDTDAHGRGLTKTTKSFENKSFLNSHDARLVRILCEFQEPGQRLSHNRIKGTILAFGSARAMLPEEFKSTLQKLRNEIPGASSDRVKSIQSKIDGFLKVEWMCEWCEKIRDLSKQLTMWALTSRELAELMKGVPTFSGEVLDDGQPMVVCTGGGPGFMEAANRGAKEVTGALSMGMGISLPFEKGLNPFVSEGLAFEFHYFFTRKFWLMYMAKALVVCPGGMGTMDELFELLTLKQTGKIPKIPIVLMCSRYWKSVVNWQAFADFGTISQAEVDSLFFADDVKTAFDFITTSIINNLAAAVPLDTDSPHRVSTRLENPVSPSMQPKPGGGLPIIQLEDQK